MIYDIVVMVLFYQSLLMKKGDYVVNVLLLLYTASAVGEDINNINNVSERFEELNTCFLSLNWNV